MKKLFLNVICAMLLIVSTGCTKNISGESSGLSETQVLEISKEEPDSASESVSVSENQTETGEEKSTADLSADATADTNEAEESESVPQVSFEDAGDYVYSTVSLNVRTGPGKMYPVMGYLEKGQKVYRTGIGGNGWSRIVLGDEEGYVSGNYLTSQYTETQQNDKTDAEEDAVYTAVDETVYSLIILNVRTGPGTHYRKVGGFERGEAVHRVAVGSNGWSKVEFRNSVYYASSQYLSREKVWGKETASVENSVSSQENTAGKEDSSSDKGKASREGFQVTAHWSGNSVRLDWSACDDVRRYIIYRSADWQKYEADRLGSGPGQAFTDTAAVSDAEYFARKEGLNQRTSYYAYYICAEHEDGSIEELGNCRISLK